LNSRRCSPFSRSSLPEILLSLNLTTHTRTQAQLSTLGCVDKAGEAAAVLQLRRS
jgi:hypothetical protein